MINFKELYDNYKFNNEKPTFKLYEAVLYNSISKVWDDALKEWRLTNCYLGNQFKPKACVCGHNNIKYLFKLENIKTKRYLYPVELSCLEKFNNKEMLEEAKALIDLAKLKDYYKKTNFIKDLKIKDGANKNIFTSRLIYYLEKKGCFNNNKMNSSFTTEFLLKMFNMRNEPLEKDKKRLAAIIKFQIIPFIKKTI